jgi:sugar/nucleoside kinase (ribokinase family)
MAIDLKRLDPETPVETIGLVGDDENGRFLAEQCDEYGIKRAQLRLAPGGATFSVDAFTVVSGLRTHLYHPGIAKVMSPDDFDFSNVQARMLHLGLPGAHRTMDAPWRADANGWVAVLKDARRHGLETNLELMTTSAERLAALTGPCLPYLDYLIVNDFEIGAVVGIETRTGGRTDFAAVRRAIAAALALGPMRVAAAHFPEGAIAGTRAGVVGAIGSVALPDSEIVGANGAGDAFAAGLLYGLHEGWDLRRALALGHCTAASSMRAISTIAGVMGWRECMALGERWGFRATPE